MNRFKLQIVITTLLFLPCISFGFGDTIRLALPNQDIGVMFIAPDFQFRGSTVKPDFTFRKYVAEKEDYKVQVFLEKNIWNFKTSKEYSDFMWKSFDMSDMLIRDISKVPFDDLFIGEFTYKKDEKSKVDERNSHAFLVSGNLCIDVYIIKKNFKPADQKLIYDIFRSIHILDSFQHSAKDFLLEGSIAFYRQNLKEAIPLYEKAFDIEKQTGELQNTDLWYVLIDQLAMTYGISKQTDKSIEVLNYGISRDSIYPMFYYMAACNYAEDNNIEKVAEYLPKAYANKARLLKGETLPDPRKDDSFKKMLNNPKFKNAIKNWN